MILRDCFDRPILNHQSQDLEIRLKTVICDMSLGRYDAVQKLIKLIKESRTSNKKWLLLQLCEERGVLQHPSPPNFQLFNNFRTICAISYQPEQGFSLPQRKKFNYRHLEIKFCLNITFKHAQSVHFLGQSDFRNQHLYREIKTMPQRQCQLETFTIKSFCLKAFES